MRSVFATVANLPIFVSCIAEETHKIADVMFELFNVDTRLGVF